MKRWLCRCPMAIVMGLMWVSAAVYPPRIFAKYPQGMGLLDFNPIYGVICAFRSAILGQEWHVRALIVSIVFAVVQVLTGARIFGKLQRVIRIPKPWPMSLGPPHPHVAPQPLIPKPTSSA